MSKKTKGNQMKVLVVGNCQAEIIFRLIDSMCDDVVTSFFRLLPSTVNQLNLGKLEFLSWKSSELDIEKLMSENDLILFQASMAAQQLIDQRFSQFRPKIKCFPRIVYTAFHPDMIYIKNARPSPTGAYHSSIACFGWAHGLGVEETVGLFSKEVFQLLGFFTYWEHSQKYLLDEGIICGLPLNSLIEGWWKRGVWMYSINHPKLFVLADLAREILGREGFSTKNDAKMDIADPLENGASWMVYPEIAKNLGVEGKYEFRRGKRKYFRVPGKLRLGLKDFVRASFKKYADYDKEDFFCPRLASEPYKELSHYLTTRKQINPVAGVEQVIDSSQISSHSKNHPYRGLPDYQFWRRAIERIPMKDVDPVVCSRFTVKREDKVATAGSCFAQYISGILRKNGFNYFITEKEENLLPEEARKRNYGVYSARFGNLYTTRQLVQLFDRAYGTFIPEDTHWERGDGKFVDPFRPQIEPEGFPAVEALEKSRTVHFAAVREMFEKLDILVFTLGLTESWRNRKDGAVYPLAPGINAGEMNSEIHEFVNFGNKEIVSDMQLFLEKLLNVNPEAKVIITVSPIPLIATYENRHVLVSTTYSKSVLRIAAEEIVQSYAMCDYFPSYEIITGTYTRGKYFEEDLRSVKPEGVNHVMRLFLAHYAEEPHTKQEQINSFGRELDRENALLAEVICDEEAIYEEI
jgi:hypothetical protein